MCVVVLSDPQGQALAYLSFGALYFLLCRSLEVSQEGAAIGESERALKLLDLLRRDKREEYRTLAWRYLGFP